MPNFSSKGWVYVIELEDGVKETPAYRKLLGRNPMVKPDRAAMYVGWSHTWPPTRYPDDDFSDAGHSLVRRCGSRRREDVRGTSHSKEQPLLRNVAERVHQLRGAGHAVFCSPPALPAGGRFQEPSGLRVAATGRGEK